MKIDARIFNPLYWHILKYLNDSSIRYIYIYGGSSAAKTYSLMQALSLESYEKGYNVLAMRKQSNNIKDTIYKDFKDFNNKLKTFLPDIDIIQNEIRSKQNLIRFKGVDDSEKLKGLAGFTKVFADELTEFNEEDLKQLKKRLRGRPNQQIIGSWNPVSKDHWIKTKVIDKEIWRDLPKTVGGIEFSKLSEDAKIQTNETGNTILIRTTYKDNYWVVGHPKFDDVGFHDKHVIADFESDKIHDENNYNIYAKGLWGVKTEGLVYPLWEQFEHFPASGKFMEVIGLDYGFTHPQSIISCFINREKREVYLYERMYESGTEFDDTTNVLNEHPEATAIIADSARPELTSSYQNIFPHMESTKKYAGSVLDGIAIVKKYKIFVHYRSTNVINENEAYSYAKNNSTGKILEEPEKKNDDAMDAIRYAITWYESAYGYAYDQ